MNSTDSGVNSVSTQPYDSLLKLWRQRWNLDMNVPAQMTFDEWLEHQVCRDIRSLVVISTNSGALVGVMPILWDDTVEGDNWLRNILRHTTYRLTHLNDAASIFKFIRAWNKA